MHTANHPMLIQEYSIQWIQDYKALKNIILASLSDLNVTIEHIGSTSIPNLAAKVIIDIDIIHNPTVAFYDIKKCLESIGYYHNGD